MTQKEETTEIGGRWWALAALALSMLTLGLDATILNVALPTLATDLHASTSELQWFAAAYTLVLGALIIPMGSLGDRFGRKRLLMIGMTVFGAASAVCAVADSASVLIAGRALQGVGGAAMMPLSLAMLPVLFRDRDERTRAMNIWVTCTAIGLPLGPIVGGYLLDHFHWGSVFLINLPLVGVGMVALALFLPETRSEHPRRADLPGIVLSSAGLVALIYGLIEAGREGWGSASALAPMLGGVALLAAFLAWERRSDYPLVDLALFSNRDFTVGTALATVSNFAYYGLLFVVPQYLQDVGGSEPLGTGVRLLPMIGGLMVATRIGPNLVKRAGARSVIIAGLVVCAAALGLGATTALDTPYAFTALWIALLGAGIGLTMPASVGTAMGALSIERAGAGTGLMQALRQVGGSIGVALLGTVLSAGYHSQLDGGQVPSFVEGAVRSSVGAGVAAADRLDSAALAHTVRTAFVHGMDAVLVASACVAILGAMIAALCLPRRAAKTATPDQDGGQTPAAPTREAAVAR